ncbi:unnamed protein product, partial [Ectocarpus sp. 13 AM-2016]
KSKKNLVSWAYLCQEMSPALPIYIVTAVVSIFTPLTDVSSTNSHTLTRMFPNNTPLTAVNCHLLPYIVARPIDGPRRARAVHLCTLRVFSLSGEIRARSLCWTVNACDGASYQLWRNGAL